MMIACFIYILFVWGQTQKVLQEEQGESVCSEIYRLEVEKCQRKQTAKSTLGKGTRETTEQITTQSELGNIKEKVIWKGMT